MSAIDGGLRVLRSSPFIHNCRMLAVSACVTSA